MPRLRTTAARAVPTVLFIFVNACAGAAHGPAKSETTAPPAVAWGDLNRDQRLQLMKTKVLPEMSRTFEGFDPKRFAKVTCATCHGESAKRKDFRMPNPGLPRLSTAGGFAKHKQEKPAITKFMMETVVPKMAGLIGEQPYDPATKKGFGCFNCHLHAD